MEDLLHFIGEELHQQQMGTMPYHDKYLQVSWNIKSYHMAL
jgi:hypothetical protein